MPSLKHKTSNTLFRFNDEHNLNKDTWYIAEKQLILFKSLELKKKTTTGMQARDIFKL